MQAKNASETNSFEKQGNKIKCEKRNKLQKLQIAAYSLLGAKMTKIKMMYNNARKT